MTKKDGGRKWEYRAQAGGVVLDSRRSFSYCIGVKSRMGADTGWVPMWVSRNLAWRPPVLPYPICMKSHTFWREVWEVWENWRQVGPGAVDGSLRTDPKAVRWELGPAHQDQRQDRIRSGSAGWACTLGPQKHNTSVLKWLISCLHYTKRAAQIPHWACHTDVPHANCS